MVESRDLVVKPILTVLGHILETDQQVEGAFFGTDAIQGLALPREVLGTIDYRNALRVYPRLQQQFVKLGYSG